MTAMSHDRQDTAPCAGRRGAVSDFERDMAALGGDQQHAEHDHPDHAEDQHFVDADHHDAGRARDRIDDVEHHEPSSTTPSSVRSADGASDALQAAPGIPAAYDL